MLYMCAILKLKMIKCFIKCLSNIANFNSLLEHFKRFLSDMIHVAIYSLLCTY